MPTNAICPPGGPLEVVFSFDTTGSMYSWLEEIRGGIQDMIQRLQADIPGIRIAVMAHGNYCDVATYVTKWVDFTTDVVKLCDFVQKVERTQGGDAPECYELVLRQARLKLSWIPGSRRVLVLIGDNNPHKPSDPCNKDKINWKDETQGLALMGVTIYGVQCGNYNAKTFYKTISTSTGGKHLRLEEFGNLFDTLMAVCYRESNNTAMLCNYEQEVRGKCGKEGLALDIDAMFTSLKNDITRDAPKFATGLDTKRPLMKKNKTVGEIALSKAKKYGGKHAVVSSLKAITQAKKLKGGNLKSGSSKRAYNKYKLINLPLLKRENVPEVNFKFRFLHWSPWILCLAGSKDVSKVQRSQWQSRGDKPGQRLKQLPITSSKSSESTFVEVSVQTNGLKGKKHVVCSQGFKRSLKCGNWEDRVLHAVSEQVDMVLQAGCNIYFRYCFLGHQEMTSVRKEIKRYDYAWACHWIKRIGARNVTKCGVTISQ